jgi:hypothetical protein
MTERQANHPSAFYNRLEYRSNPTELRKLTHNALDAVEDLLDAEKTLGSPALTFSYRDGIAVQKLSITDVEDLVQRDVTIRTKSFSEGALRESTRVSIREYIEDSPYPFISRYLFERYSIQAIQTSVARTDVLSGSGLDEREMLPYDFHEFEGQLNVIVAMRKHALVGPPLL